MKAKKPYVIAVLPGFTASTLLDVVKPLLRLRAMGKIRFQTKLEQYTSSRALSKASLVIFCRNTEPKYQKSLDYLINHNIPFIYDLDDNLFEIPLDTQLGQYHRAPERQVTLQKYIQNAYLVRVYSVPLLKKVEAFTDRAIMVTAPLDWSIVSPSNQKESQEKRTRIVYATSRKEDHLWQVFSRALKDFLITYNQQVEMYFWGYFPQEFSGLKNVHSLPFEPNYSTFLKKFSQAGFHIGLSPLIDDNFHNAKTNNKFREYGSCRVAGIYSNVPVYRECIQHMKDGYLVENTSDDWYSALEQLVNNIELRKEIIQNAYEKIKANYSHTAFDQIWDEQIKLVIDSHDYHQSTMQEKTGNYLASSDAKIRAPNRLPPAWLSQRYGQLGNKYRKEGLSGVITAIKQELINFYFLLRINLFRSI